MHAPKKERQLLGSNIGLIATEGPGSPEELSRHLVSVSGTLPDIAPSVSVTVGDGMFPKLRFDIVVVCQGSTRLKGNFFSGYLIEDFHRARTGFCLEEQPLFEVTEYNFVSRRGFLAIPEKYANLPLLMEQHRKGEQPLGVRVVA